MTPACSSKMNEKSEMQPNNYHGYYLELLWCGSTILNPIYCGEVLSQCLLFKKYYTVICTKHIEGLIPPFFNICKSAKTNIPVYSFYNIKHILKEKHISTRNFILIRKQPRSDSKTSKLKKNKQFVCILLFLFLLRNKSILKCDKLCYKDISRILLNHF